MLLVLWVSGAWVCVEVREQWSWGWGISSLLPPVSSKDRTQVLRLDNKYLYPLNQPASVP